jgi:Na+/H+ antiporter NhaD/arsenite permease-like protein
VALFSTLAGNLTIVGSVANMIVLEGAGRDGKITFWVFFRYGLAVTTLTLVVAYALLCLERVVGWI